ncbi:hypothetical protein GCM10027089_22200 [Nocardia thraciensis]
MRWPRPPRLPGRVWLECGYDLDQDVVFLQVGRDSAALSPYEVYRLIGELQLSVAGLVGKRAA